MKIMKNYENYENYANYENYETISVFTRKFCSSLFSLAGLEFVEQSLPGRSLRHLI